MEANGCVWLFEPPQANGCVDSDNLCMLMVVFGSVSPHRLMFVGLPYVQGMSFHNSFSANTSSTNITRVMPDFLENPQSF